MSKQDLPLYSNSRQLQVAQAITEALSEQIGQTIFEMWFEGSDPIVFDGQQVQVFAPNAFSLSRLQSRFSGDVKEAVHRIAGPETSIQFATRSETAADQPSSDIATSSEVQNDDNPVDGFIGEKDPQTYFHFHQPCELKPAPKSRPKNAKPARYVKSFWFGDENRLALSLIHI